MNKRIKRILALVLSLLMIIQIMPMTAMAETVTDELSSDNTLPDEWTEPDSTTDPEEADPGEADSQTLVEDIQPPQDNEEKPEESASDSPDEQQVSDLTDGSGDEQDFHEDEYVDSPEDAPEPDPDEEDPYSDPYEDGDELPEDTEVIYDDPEYFEPWEPASEEEEVEVLYDGSWIRYGVYKYGHTYALTEGTTRVYDDSGLGADHLICTLPDEYTPLLVTEHYQRGNTLGVTVWFVLPDGTVQTGYVQESDLVNAIYTDEEAETWTEYMDYRQINVDGASLLAFVVNGVAFAATENEPESEVPADEPVDVPIIEPIDDPIDDPIEQISEEETEAIPEMEETEAETEVQAEEELIEELPVEEEPVDEGDVIETVTTRSGAVTYGTLRAESEMPVPITTRPRAYIFANRRGYISINSADGGVFTTYNNTYSVGNSYVTVLGYNRYHHALVKVEWYDTENSVTRILLVEAAYMRPVDKTYETTVVDSAGNVYPNWDVNVYDGKGDYVTTVKSDANGIARYTGLHLDIRAMLRYAELHYEETDTNVLIDNNDCATFVSECLTEGGFTVYGAYASNNPDGPYSYGYGLYDRLQWLGVPGTSSIDITKLSPGDVVFMHPKSSTTSPYGHSMIIGAVNIETGQVLLYGHSSNDKDHNHSNKMWIDISALCYVAYTSIYDYSFDYELPTRIIVIKRDADTWAELAGAVIDLYKDGQLIETHTTTSDGRVLFTNLEPGEYIVKERYAPEGYRATAETWPVTAVEGDTVQLEITNRLANFSIRIYKMDARDPSICLPGAVFALYDESGTQVGAPMATDENGQILWTNLPEGVYRLHEISAPEGYTVVPEDCMIEVDNGDSERMIYNYPIITSLQIVKSSSEGDVPLVGAEYELVTRDAAGYHPAISAVDGSVLPNVITDENGKGVWEGLRLGEYYVHEVAAPEGYLVDNAYYPVQLGENNLPHRVEVTDDAVHCRIKIKKTNAETKEPLAGAEFTITRLSAPASQNGAGVGDVVAVLTTGADGTVETDWLEWGKYEVRETKAPAHFLNSGFSKVIEAYEDGKTYEVTVDNSPARGQIRLTKADAADGHPIADVIFDIYQGDRLVGSMKTDENGIAISDPLPTGRYTVKERENPEGYVFDLVTMDCEVTSEEVTELKAENTPIQFQVRILKKDGQTKLPLAGAEFTITRISGLPSMNGKDDGEVVAILVTDENGEAMSEMLTWGKYEVKETKAPEHYAEATFAETVAGAENERVYELSVENEPMMGGIRLTKTDALDGHTIAGVLFDIYQGKELVGTMTTDANGVAVSGSLPKGQYTVKEHGNPEGYVADLVSLDCEVNPDEITELTATNNPIQFRIRILKTDGLTKKPLAGAEFTIKRTCGLPSHNGEDDGKTVAVLTTDENGEAVSELLTWGEYEIRETKAPEHYAEAAFVETITGTEHEKVYEVTVENEPTMGWIQITKTDRLNGGSIAGVVFDIYQDDMLVGSMTTDENGMAVSGMLPKGQYTVREHDNPEGYTDDLVSMDCEVKSDEATVLSAENTQIQFRIKILKTDGQTKEPLAGAEFTVTRISGLPSANGENNGETVAVLTTDENGEAITGLLTWGKYEVRETKAPEHYASATFVGTVAGTEDQKVYELHVENQPTKGQIRLKKTDALDGFTIAGVVFDIYQSETLIGSMKTDENGIAISDPLPKGQYTVREHENPEGYVAELFTTDCEVRSDEITELKASNMPIRFRVKILKTDGLTKEPLSGAEFTITRVSGLPSRNGVGDGDIVATLTTDENGVAISDYLTWGVYQVTETKAPAHYAEADFSETVTGTENERVYELHVENEPTWGWIRLTKTDALDGHAIEGVVFDIWQGDTLVTSMTTDVDGVAISAPLPKGKYTVKEHGNPEGYVDELASLDCEVFSDETTELRVDNMPIQFRIRILKTDQQTRQPLAGAEFTIIRKSGLPSHADVLVEGEDVAAVLVTDENGEAVSDLLTWGVYEVKETKVPTHYVDNHFTRTVEGTENDQTYEILCENEPTRGYIRIVKTDELDQTPIEGVQFDIYSNDEYGDGLVGTMTTGKDGVAVSPALRKGKYIVKERGNPTGYTTELVELDCEVLSDETTQLSCTNTPIQGKIRIIKTDELTGAALAGAEFTVTRISGLPSHKGSNDGEVVAVITTNAEGVAITPLLTWGTYRIAETGVPQHYVDRQFSTEITIASEDLLDVDVKVDNEPTKGWIRLTKTDRKNGNPIAGVKFDIFYNDAYGSGLAGTMVTDENGVAMSEPLRKGVYTVKEHGATAGYVFEEISLDCTVKSDEITDLSATNQPVQVRLRLYKRDQDEYTKTSTPADVPGTRGDAILTGAVFQVVAGANITDRQGNVLFKKGDVVIESLKTDGDDASVLTGELWPGLYEIVELEPPTGYQPSSKSVKVDATSAAKQSVEAVITYEGVKTNEVLYGRYAFVKFLGDNQVHTDPGLIETPEKGAVFQIFLKSAGSYENARKFERDQITTDRYGKAQTKLLPYGIYTVVQIKGKEGYAIKAPFDIFIRGTEDPQNPPTMIINNEAIHYRLKFIKVDEETGKTIAVANTAFKLKDAEGNYIMQTVHYPTEETIDIFRTDADGTVTLPETVTYGLYYVEEFQAPEGYLILTKDLPVFVGDENMNQPGEAYLLEFVVENAPVKGRIRLEKTGLRLTGFRETESQYGYTVMQPVYEEKRLVGAVFEVHAAENIVGRDGTLWYEQDALVDTITTTAECPDVSKELPLGRYYLVEVSAPDGYTFDDRRYEANLVCADDHTPLVETVVTASNDYLPVEISLTKEKEVLAGVTDGRVIRQVIHTAPGAGFVFGLYNDTDVRYDGGTLMADTLVAVGETDENGKLTFSGSFPHGRYSIRELYAPEGWKMTTDRNPVNLDPANADEDHVIRVTLPEAIHNELVWYPVTLTKTDITGEQTLPGALIEVSDNNGEVIYRTYTDQNGQIPNIPVVPGTYTFREVFAPSGYALSDAVMRFTVDQDGGITGDRVIRDDYTRILLRKVNETGQPLQGVEFTLKKSSGAVLMKKASDANGCVVFEKIPYGNYIITESAALAGYQRHEVSINLTVDGTFVNSVEPLQTIVNYPITLRVKKVDQDGRPLPGAEYALINEFDEQVMTAVSDRNGMLTFTRVPYGKYTLKELSAPEGYLCSRQVTEIIVDENWRNSEEPVATVVNHLKRLKYIKVDTSGRYLPGVEFSLINASTNEVVEVVTSNSRGEFIFTKFDYGFWRIRETKVPEGYAQMEDLNFNVDADWTEPAPFTCVNIPNHYEFVKTDNEGHPMAGVKFTLEDADGNILNDLVSGEDGIVHVTGLKPGTYIIREIETREGYTVSGETIEVVIDEKYVVPAEMYVLVNYPSIQTGVDFEITPLMWGGGAAVLLGLILLIVFIRRRRR